MPEIVVENRTDDDGNRFLTAISLDEQGNLYFRGYDSGPRVKGMFGKEDYEYSRRVAASDVLKVLGTLLYERFGANGSAFADWAKEREIHVGFDWW